MMSPRNTSFALVLLLLSTWPSPGHSETPEATDTRRVSVEQTLLCEAVELPAPAFAAQTLPEGLEALDRLNWPIGEAWPTADTSWRIDSRRSLHFERMVASGSPFGLGRPARAAVRLFAFYVDVTAFAQVQAEIETAHRARVWLDGSVQLEKKASDAEDADPSPGLEKSEWALDPGLHRVVVEALFDPDQSAPWDLRLGFDVPAETSFDVGLSPRHRLGLTELLDAETVRWMGVSSDGKVLAVGMGTPQPPSDHSRSWIDFYDTESGRVLRSLEGMGTLSSFQWDPREGSRHFAFVASHEEKSTLWVSSLEGGPNHRVLTDEEHFGSFWWLPDGRGLLFSRSEEGPKDPENFKRYRGLTDRWEGHRSHSFLYRVDLESSVVERLTDGELTTSLQDIHPDSKRLLFTRTIEEDNRWPFSRDVLYELDLASLDTTRICDVDNGLSAKYTDDDQQLLVLANPMAFGGVGLDVPEGTTANLYDGQAFLFDRAAGKATAISRDFDPSIGSVQVLPDQDRIYARVTDRSFDSIYVYDLDRERWEEVPTELESVQRFAVSRDGSTLVYQGTSSSVPSRIYTMRLRGRPRSELLVVQDAANVARVNYGAVEDYDVVVSTGEIKGRIYYPPDFDPSRKYPAIVYYYGGTVPVTRSYGGRYPKELWASHGYVVYVPQPSGAVGFGQEFSARHVNNWGATVADEIIDASKKFLAQHSFVDPERVGCIGASYGGFMTMLLTTRTDMFAGAVSHAGISALSSYWGEGDWGYSYSAAATAHSYPWNRPDLYVEQSPLFAADKVVTPILLLHGGIDNNVPPGESEQFYTALRVLGKEVEFVRIAGERHWILTYDKRKLWAQSILAWFDRTLKGDPGWWDHLYSSE